LIASARAVGERIATLALQKNKDVSWVGVTLMKERTWHLMPLGTDLYDGTPGVILFLAYLGSITGEEKFTELAQRALRSCRRQIEQGPEELRRVIGAFNGRAGWIYLLTHLGMLWGETRFLAEAETNAGEVAEFIEADTHLDIISGTSGTLGALLALQRCRPSVDNLAAPLRCGDHLVARARAMPHGVAWDTEVPSVQPLTGFSHGAAGIAWSLLELFDVTGAERFRKIAREAVAYERSVFSVEKRNWPDFRANHSASEENQDQQLRYAALWCHGSGGIALSRMAALKHLDGPEIRSDVHNALRTTLSEGFGYNHSLCHGDLGNIEVLQQARNLHPTWATDAERKTRDVLAGIDEHGWLCGVPHEVESPGLMTGLAGIGYGLLRVACPDRVPSVLLLEGPGIAFKAGSEKSR
jgi:type 2 lantibiotic biosynthesis protein LanM